MELDPRDVLHHLQALGYENIDPGLLQQFMKDLKKLIKYEKRKSRDNENINVNTDLTDTNSKNGCLLDDKKVILPNNQCKKACCNKQNDQVFERLAHPKSKTRLCSKYLSTVAVQTDLSYKQTKGKKYSQIFKKTDPVSLHQYYQKEWQTHKAPGEKNHDKLRWQVRQMMTHK